MGSAPPIFLQLPVIFAVTQSLSDYLKSQNILGIADIDTRRLTNRLRETGAQDGCIMTYNAGEEAPVAQALEAAKAFPGLAGMDLAKVATCSKTIPLDRGTWKLGTGTHATGRNQISCSCLRFWR